MLKPNDIIAKPVVLNMPKAVEKDKRVRQTEVFGKDVVKKSTNKRPGKKSTTKST